ncbi:hypothetical protein VUR80DRAFT_8592 [Thermomyces stellatus]
MVGRRPGVAPYSAPAPPLSRHQPPLAALRKYIETSGRRWQPCRDVRHWRQAASGAGAPHPSIKSLSRFGRDQGFEQVVFIEPPRKCLCPPQSGEKVEKVISTGPTVSVHSKCPDSAHGPAGKSWRADFTRRCAKFEKGKKIIIKKRKKKGAENLKGEAREVWRYPDPHRRPGPALFQNGAVIREKTKKSSSHRLAEGTPSRHYVPLP